jgi:hypothetical protein
MFWELDKSAGRKEREKRKEERRERDERLPISNVHSNHSFEEASR